MRTKLWLVFLAMLVLVAVISFTPLSAVSHSSSGTKASRTAVPSAVQISADSSSCSESSGNSLQPLGPCVCVISWCKDVNARCYNTATECHPNLPGCKWDDCYTDSTCTSADPCPCGACKGQC